MLIFSWARFAREFQIIIFTNKYFKNSNKLFVNFIISKMNLKILFVNFIILKINLKILFVNSVILKIICEISCLNFTISPIGSRTSPPRIFYSYCAGWVRWFGLESSKFSPLKSLAKCQNFLACGGLTALQPVFLLLT